MVLFNGWITLYFQLLTKARIGKIFHLSWFLLELISTRGYLIITYSYWDCSLLAIEILVANLYLLILLLFLIIVSYDILQTGSKLEKEYIKAVYCHPTYLTYMQSKSWETLSWKKHELESRLRGEISRTSDRQMTPPLWQKVKRN